MTGTISPAICRLTRLSSLTIADWKGITSEIPKCITTLPYLRIFDLIGNKISGEIPSGIGRLHLLTVLNCRQPHFRPNPDLTHQPLQPHAPRPPKQQNFGGAAPRFQPTRLSRNFIGGTIPSSISQIYRLADLDLSLNQISGPIPPTIGKMAVLATLNLDSNKISGRIPPSLLVSGISNLNLSKNFLDGIIPDVFGTRSYFTVIDLSFNKLRGNIPKSIISASYIGHLDLSHNHLCGRIPAGSPFDHLEASSFAYNDCLCGKPLKTC